MIIFHVFYHDLRQESFAHAKIAQKTMIDFSRGLPKGYTHNRVANVVTVHDDLLTQ